MDMSPKVTQISILCALPKIRQFSKKNNRNDNIKYDDADNHHSHSHIRINSGFTLIELVVTLSVIAIIISLAAPAILTLLANMEAKRIRYEVMNTLAVAKAESLIQRQNLLVCLSDSNGYCNKNSDKTLLLFIDKNDNKNFDVGVDQLIEEQTLDPRYGTLHLRAGKRHYVKFYGDSGKPRGHFGHIKYCPSSSYSTAMYQISFNQTGIIKYKPNETHPTKCD